MDATAALLIAVIVIIVIVALYFAGAGKRREEGVIEKISVGNYLAGLPDAKEKKDGVECTINEGYYIFKGAFDKELGRIPRNCIIDVMNDSKNQILQRLSVTKDLTFAAFGLDKPKSTLEKEYCLVIDWDDNFGTRHNTVFEFGGVAAESSAHKATEALKRHQKPHLPRLRPDEKKCPYCAEIIKKEALVCRFCNKRI